MDEMKDQAGSNEEKVKKKRNKQIRAQVYKNNPFMEANYPMVQTRTKRITNNRGGYMVKSDSGEVVSQIAGFWQAEEVDSTKFIKLFVNGVKAFSGLTNKGTKVFELMYYEIQNNIGKDKIYLNVSHIDQDIVKISRSYFYEGLKELIEKKFLAPTDVPNFYWINPDYVWNGDRLAFVKTYIKKQSNSIPKRDENTLELPFEPFEEKTI